MKWICVVFLSLILTACSTDNNRKIAVRTPVPTVNKKAQKKTKTLPGEFYTTPKLEKEKNTPLPDNVLSQNAGPILVPGDIIKIEVIGEPELTGEFTIPGNGIISYPLIKQFNAYNKTTQILVSELKEKLENFLRDPVINIFISQWKDRQVFLYGLPSGSRSMSLSPDNPISLSRLLIQAGVSPQTVDLSNVAVIRKQNNGQKTTLKINIQKILENYNLEQDLILWPDDLIILKKSNRVYIKGSISNPGAYPITGMENMTLWNLILQADGPRLEADLESIQIIRESKTGKRNTYWVSTSDNDNRPIYLKANDIVIIPSRRENYATIYGEVKKPGTIKLPLDGQVRLSTVIAMAGGLTEYASRNIRIFRYNENGEPQKFVVNLNDITSGDIEQDLEIKPRDLIYIDSSIW